MPTEPRLVPGYEFTEDGPRPRTDLEAQHLRLDAKMREAYDLARGAADASWMIVQRVTMPHTSRPFKIEVTDQDRRVIKRLQDDARAAAKLASEILQGLDQLEASDER